MSRIGRNPIAIPAGVTVTVGDENLVTVKGPLGTLTEQLNKRMNIEEQDGKLIVTRPTDEDSDRALHGLTRTLLNNMVEGVTKGYSKTLQLVGVGYRAQMKGKTLVLSVGFSHPVEMQQPDDLDVKVEKGDIIISGCDKQHVGDFAAEVRAVRSPEPYKGKGIRYMNEHIIRKEGKTGK